MSSLYVRNLADQWAQALTVPYFNTVNESQTPDVVPWCTLEFNVYSTTKDTHCEHWTETGAVRLVFFGRPGQGFADLFAQAETDINNFYSNVDPDGFLTLEVKGAPVEFGGSDTPWYGVECLIDYVYFYE
jgi:hypothetical protein